MRVPRPAGRINSGRLSQCLPPVEAGDARSTCFVQTGSHDHLGFSQCAGVAQHLAPPMPTGEGDRPSDILHIGVKVTPDGELGSNALRGGEVSEVLAFLDAVELDLGHAAPPLFLFIKVVTTVLASASVRVSQ